MENCQDTNILDTRSPDHGLIDEERKEMLSQDGAQSEELGWKCFICDAQLTTKTSTSVFYTMLPKSEVLLSNALNKVLKTSYVAPHTMRSPVVCNDCFNVLDILEVAEEQYRRLRRSLLSNYIKTCALYNQMVDHEDGVACQTEDILDNINTSFADTSEDDETPLSQLVVQIKQEDSAVVSSSSSKPKAKKIKLKVKKKKKREAQAERNRKEHVATDQSELENKYSMDEDSDDPTTHTDLTCANVKPDPDLVVSDAVLTEQKKRKRKKYQCTYHDCSRLFRRPGEVKNHILVFHLGKNPNQCTFCNKTFNSRNGLYVHLKRAHQMEYSERKELVSKDYDLELEEKLATSYEEKPVHTSSNTTDVDEDVEDNEGDEDGKDNNSDFEWAEEAASPPPQKRTNRSSDKKKSRRRSRSNSRRRKEKENLESNQDNSSPRKKVIKVKCLDEDKICDEIMVKEEEGEGGEEAEDNYEEEDAEYSAMSGGERNEEEEEGGETTDGERKKKSHRTSRGSRAGDRVMMPLIHACDQCGKKWRTVSELNAHIKTHSDLRPYVCEICGQGYKLKKALDVHVGMHNGVYPFTCHFCNKSFTQKVGLQKHIPIHTGYSRFQCDLCGKRFIHQKSFQIHKMVHSGEKNIKCNVCGLAVLSSSHLTRHYRVHTGERPYQCTICGKRFAEKYNLNAHQKIHQPPGADGQKEGTPRKRSSSHKCQLCRFTTTKKTSLQAHWESEHKSAVNGATLPSYETSRDVTPCRVIPQMTIDPSGSLTYEEKPLVDENARTDSGRLGSQSEPKFDPTSDVGYRDRSLPGGLSSYREQRTIPIITEVASRYSALMPQHLLTHAQAGHAHHGFGGGALHE
uniref:Zinc finger protein 226 n=1 Tax=Cacopsylla melanoneura TaxID=428564 RepID=A0A8D8WPG4_9HEMI